MHSSRVTVVKLLLLYFAIFGIAKGEQKKPIRGVWIVRHVLTTPEKIDQMVDMATRCGFTDLFVQVRGRGDAYYDSFYEPRAEDLPDNGFDPLAYLLKKAKPLGFRVHAWVNVFYIWSKDSLPKSPAHLVLKNGNWLAVPFNQPDERENLLRYLKKNGSEGLYLSPLHPGVQKFITDVVEDIVTRYPVDGIHLDYIRFPNRTFDVHPVVLNGFQREYILDPRKMLLDPNGFAGEFGVSGYESFYRHWGEYLMNGLSRFVGTLSETVRKQRPGIIISAAVKPDIALARWDYYQDWVRWLKKGWLDYAVVMNYSADSHIFTDRLEQYIDEVPLDHLLVGIALYNQPETDAIRKIYQVRALKNAGIVLFSYDQVSKQKRVQKVLINELDENQ